MCSYQGGDVNQLEHLELLPQAKHIIELPSKQSGYLSRLHAQKLGIAAMRLGAGRATKTDQIDHAAGIVLHHKVGDSITQGEILAEVHTNTELSDEWIEAFYDAVAYSGEKVAVPPLIAKIIDNE
ncbi:hypothetical protein D5266_06415 [bacterium c-19]|nr:hypothetical protein [bacterium c-19]